MINRQELIPQYAKEYFQLGLRGYAFFSTELVRGCSDEERNRLFSVWYRNTTVTSGEQGT